MDKNTALKNIVELSREISEYVVGAEGNTSVRFSDGFFIKSSGSSLRNSTRSDFVFCNLEGNNELSEKRPSIEVDFHSWIYRNLDVDYIAHTHPVNALKILCSNRSEDFSLKRLFPDHVVYNGKYSCLVDYCHPGKELAESIGSSVDKYIEKNGLYPKIILLKNHGIITLGKSQKECIFSTQICEKAAQIYLGSIFDQTYLSENEIEAIIKDKKEIWRQTIVQIK